MQMLESKVHQHVCSQAWTGCFAYPMIVRPPGIRIPSTDIGRWLRSVGLERWLRQLKRSRQCPFSFSRELRLMSSHEDGGNNNED